MPAAEEAGKVVQGQAIDLSSRQPTQLNLACVDASRLSFVPLVMDVLQVYHLWEQKVLVMAISQEVWEAMGIATPAIMLQSYRILMTVNLVH